MLGIDATLLLAELSYQQFIWKTKRQLLEGGFFFRHREMLEKDTTLTLHRLTQALEILVSRKFVTTKKEGIPLRLYYRVEDEKINLIIKDLEFNDDVSD